MGQLVVAESGLEKDTQDILKNARDYQEQAVSLVQEKHTSLVCFTVLRMIISVT